MPPHPASDLLAAHEPLRPILLAEDDPVDVGRTRDALARCRIGNPIEIARNGAEALDCLHGIGHWLGSAACNPALVILDLELPEIDGLEVLDRLKTDPRLCDVPVVMLAPSHAERELVLSYGLGIDAVVVKPIDSARFMRAMHELDVRRGRRRKPPAPGAAQ